jgi:phospholipid/cholesterol/gamma-HCH transport system permease protein
MTVFQTVGEAVHFAFRAVVALPIAVTRGRDFSVQLYQIFLRALPLALVGGFALGAVIWLHAREPLRTVGGSSAVEILPRALAKVVVLELASIIAGLIVAARSGASLGAELSSMRLTEQIDALEILGVSPMARLVAPRVLACMVGLPLLTVFVTYAAVLSGYLMQTLGGTMSFTHYRNEALSLLLLRDAIPSLVKTTLFGFLIGITGCFCGLHAQGGTEGVGRAATQGVVVSILLVFIADVAFVLLMQLLV